MSVISRMWLLPGLWLCSALVFAEASATPGNSQVTAHEVVRDATARVMEVVEAAHKYADEDPERYYAAVHEVLDPVIDFRGFARNVMGPYGSSKRYKSLDEAGRAQLRKQLDQFTGVMRAGLVKTYSKGLLAFSGNRIEVSKPSANEAAESLVSVRQLIYSQETEPYVVMYQMGRNKAREWKLRNVIIETVNLGDIYRNQFQAAARKHDGDLNTVIANWDGTEVDS